MSPSNEFQALIHARLIADPAVAALVGERIYDNVPAGAAHPYISFGPSDFGPVDMDGIQARDETLQIDIWSRQHGRRSEAAAINDAVYRALHNQRGSLAVNAITSLQVALARVVKDPDGITMHGVIQVTARIEEA